MKVLGEVEGGSMNTSAPATMVQARRATVHLVKAGLRTACAPLRARALKRYNEIGLPSQLYPAFAYLMTGSLNARERAVIARVEALRARLAARGSMTIADYAGKLEVPGVELHTFKEIAERVSVTQRFGIFLYLCAEGFKAKRILELGACAGISGSYLASASSCVEFVTLELSPALSVIARENLGQITPNATVINADFDKGLGAVIGPESAPFDLVWIDGHHQKEPTLRYFERLQPHIAPGGLVLFDDIAWTTEMREAWDILRKWPGFSQTINATRMGLGVLKQTPDDAPPRNWTLRRRLGITTFEPE